MTEQFPEAMDKATNEYKSLFHKLRFIKKASDRVSAVNMCFMRSRDIERELTKPDHRQFCFTISMYDPEAQTWTRCPGCGNPDINKTSQNGNDWQGCYRCDILLDKYGKIKSMDHTKKREKKEEKQPETEFQTASEMAEGGK